MKIKYERTAPESDPSFISGHLYEFTNDRGFEGLRICTKDFKNGLQLFRLHDGGYASSCADASRKEYTDVTEHYKLVPMGL